MKHLYSKWKRFTQKVVIVQSNIIFTVIYGVIFIPLSLLVKLFSKRLLRSFDINSDSPTNWKKREKEKYSLKWAKQQ